MYAVLAMLLLNLFVFRSITVDGESMNNTLQDQDRVLSTNFFYTPQRGDIVVLQADKIPNQYTGKYGEPIIKRVIALAGDTIKFDFDEGKVYLKKAWEQESLLTPPTGTARPQGSRSSNCWRMITLQPPRLHHWTDIPARSIPCRRTVCS